MPQHKRFDPYPSDADSQDFMASIGLIAGPLLFIASIGMFLYWLLT